MRVKHCWRCASLPSLRSRFDSDYPLGQVERDVAWSKTKGWPVQTLLLNASYEPIRVVDLERAMYYLVTGKAEIVETYDRIIRSVSQVFQHPKVIKLKRYVKIKQHLKGVKYSRKNILARDKMICQYCGIKCDNRNATLDHVIPKSRGGKNSWENIVTSCADCNNKKDNRTPQEAGLVLLNVPRRPKGNGIIKCFMPEYSNW